MKTRLCPAQQLLPRLWRAVAVLALCAQLSACSTLVQESPALRPAPAPGGSRAAVVIQAAQQQVGVPYRYGGVTPRGFDCSGLVHYAHLRAGIEVPRTTGEQLRQARRVPLSQVRPGDVLFFRVDATKISHVGLYVGDGRFVHAPSSGKRVSYASLNDEYWSRHIMAAGRFY